MRLETEAETLTTVFNRMRASSTSPTGSEVQKVPWASNESPHAHGSEEEVESKRCRFKNNHEV